MRGWHNESYRHSLAARGIRTTGIRDDYPTLEGFMQYHQTGCIPFGAYEQYRTIEGIKWLGTKDKYPVHIKTMEVDGEEIEIRVEIRRDLMYVKHDESGNILRDEKGDAIYLTLGEVKERGLAEVDVTVVAFNEMNQPVGWASNEFGCDGVWVVDEYQGKGIGLELLYQFRKFYPSERKMGQMTHVGSKTAEAYYRRMVGER